MSMTSRDHAMSAPSAGLGRLLILCYGAFAYTVFFGTFLYAIAFVEGYFVPTTLDIGWSAPPARAVLINLALLTLFAVQHSGMARRGFKRVFTAYFPPAMERSTYVLLASLSLIIVFAFWHPVPLVVWQVTNPAAATFLKLLSGVGWLLVLYSTFLISHFELFGLKQAVSSFMGRSMPRPEFKTPALYGFVRHPIYLGFIIAFWATPVMTAGHLLFAGVTTAYIFVGIVLEERDLVHTFGDEYRRYRDRVAMLLPWRKHP
jgi:methanethiol S-methyltransferase